MLTILIPSHNEGTKPNGSVQITETLTSLAQQTYKPDRIIVIADNCVDDTVELAIKNGTEVFETVNNSDKKSRSIEPVAERQFVATN